MLNELYQVVAALEARGISIEEQHQSLTPMGKNDPLLVIEVDTACKPSIISIEQGQIAGTLLRICHGSQGASFPGFNLPTPLRVFDYAAPDRVKKYLSEVRRRRHNAEWGGRIVSKLFARSRDADFTDAQSRQFRRSSQELTGWLRDDFAEAGPELANFSHLLQVVGDAHMELTSFASQVAQMLAALARQSNAETQMLAAEWLFTNRKLPVYLECGNENLNQCRVADVRMGTLLNRRLLEIDAKPYDSASRRDSETPPAARDAYTGLPCEIPGSFPDPKVAQLGNVRIFSNNTAEAGCFFRYGLGGSETFKVSKATAQRMAGALLQLASERHLNKTCRAIPSSRDGQQDLLVAYLEDEPFASDPYVDVFGTEAASFDAPDFAASVRPVLDALAGKVAANPNQLLRLIAIAPLDKANKQVSLNRSFTVREVAQAAIEWQAGASNCPPITLTFFEKQAREPIRKSNAVPGPLDTASLLNRVWSIDTKGNFSSKFQRIISVSDAYDIFIAPPAMRESKTRLALQNLTGRMRDVFAATGALKAGSAQKSLNSQSRWQVLKAIALIGILLHQLGERYDIFMKEPTYQLGRLLAYADSLHQQYCKHVRGNQMPAQLIGNALFTTALEQPAFALARLAERLAPYQGWARTFQNSDPGVKSGYEKTLLGLIGECSSNFIEEHDGAFVIRVDQLPARMTDIDKAKLLLGYLADSTKS